MSLEAFLVRKDYHFMIYISSPYYTLLRKKTGIISRCDISSTVLLHHQENMKTFGKKLGGRYTSMLRAV